MGRGERAFSLGRPEQSLRLASSAEVYYQGGYCAAHLLNVDEQAHMKKTDPQSYDWFMSEPLQVYTQSLSTRGFGPRFNRQRRTTQA